MTRRRLFLYSTALAVAMFRLFACEPMMARYAPRPSPSASASASPDGSATTVVGPPQRPPLAMHPRFDKAILLANGHVLMPAKDVVYDWDPFAAVPMRKVGLGDAGPAHTFSFAPLGGRRFVVAKTDEDDNVDFELWDAERLVRIRELGKYVAETPFVDFSRDGNHLMLLACAAAKDETRTCEVGVHDLATGDLVHRTQIPPLPTIGRSRVDGRLSSAGSYFALSGESFQTTAYEAATGRRVYRNESTLEADIDDDILHFAFLDDRRLLTASTAYGVRLTDLSTARAMTRRLRSTSSSPRVLVSPSRDRVALHLTRDDGTFGVALLAADDGSGHDVAIPRAICPETCAMRWSGPRELVFHANVDPASLQLRVDAVTGKAVTEAYREPPPFDVFGVHPVHGDFDPYGTSGTTQWHPEGHSLVTPKGVRIDLATLDMGALMSAVGDRFFLDGIHGIRLLTSDGASAEIFNPVNPPP